MRAIKNRPLKPEEYRGRIQQYQEAATPFLHALSNIMAIEIPRLVLLPSGKLERAYSDQVHAALNQVNQILDILHKEIMGTDRRELAGLRPEFQKVNSNDLG